ncbi:MAG: cellulose synthase operon protein YhjQ/BcsQ [Pseudomonadota bacterium]|nr:cellulose synthase operon protein YhjQ/BcsQ [Pseudomonadota bacterium]
MINRDNIKIDKSLFLAPKTHITAITSGLGSMGKTWLSVTLAHALNMLQESVLLFDANNGLLNADFQLDLPDKYGLNEVIDGKMTLNQVITPVNKKKFDIICGQAGSDLLESVPLGRLHILCDELALIAQNYNEVIIDLPSSEKILYNLLPPANIILVCTSEPSNLVSTYDFLQKNIGSLSYKSLQIVINYANSYEEGLRTYNTLRRACEQYMTETPRLLGIIRRDTKVRDAIRNHVLLLNRYPTSEAAEDVLNIARKLWIKEAGSER